MTLVICLTLITAGLKFLRDPLVQATIMAYLSPTVETVYETEQQEAA